MYIGGYGDFYGNGPQSYLSQYTYAPASLAAFSRPAETAVFADSAYFDDFTPLQKTVWLSPPSQGALYGNHQWFEVVHGRHVGNQANVVWMDGHASSIKPTVLSPDSAHINAHLGYIQKSNGSANDYYYGGPEAQP
jgi:prepilin-type processing-associated H-X9-DG protein